MNLNEVKTLAEHTMWEHGLIQKGWTFAWGHGKQTFGTCVFRKVVTKNRRRVLVDVNEIRISKHLSAINDKETVMDTILHEIAHALVGRGHGHDYVWKSKAREIGCNAKRTFNKDDAVTIDRPSKSCATINGRTYRSGDTIYLQTRNGVQPCIFVEYLPRNHKYPIIATKNGKRFKYTKHQVRSEATR